MPRAFTASVAPRRTASVLLVAAPVLLLVPRSGRSWVSAPHLGAPTRTAAARRRGTKARTVVAVRMRRGPFCTVAFEAEKIASASAPSAFSGCERTSAIHGRTGNGKKMSVYCTCDRVSVSHTQALFFRSYTPSRISFSSWEPLIPLTRIFAGGASENNCKRFRAVGVLRSPHAHRSRTHEDSTVYPCLPRIRGRLDHAGALTAPGI